MPLSIVVGPPVIELVPDIVLFSPSILFVVPFILIVVPLRLILGLFILTLLLSITIEELPTVKVIVESADKKTLPFFQV